MALQPGQIVQLRSGGPLMTVTKIDGKQVTCMYFVQETSEFRTQVFEEPWLDEIDIEDDDDEEDE